MASRSMSFRCLLASGLVDVPSALVRTATFGIGLLVIGMIGCGASESPSAEPAAELPEESTPPTQEASTESTSGAGVASADELEERDAMPASPLEGVGVLRFGMSRSEVESLLGDERHPHYVGTRVPYQPYFDDADQLVAIDVQVTYLSQEIHVDGVLVSKEQTVEQLIEAYGDCGPSDMGEGGSQRICHEGAVAVAFGSGAPDEPILRVRGGALPMATLSMRLEGEGEAPHTVALRLEGVGELQETRLELPAGVPTPDSLGLGGVSLFSAGQATQLYAERIEDRVVLLRRVTHEEGSSEGEEVHSFTIPARQTLRVRIEGVSSPLTMACPEGMARVVSCTEGPAAHVLCAGNGRFRFEWRAENVAYEGLLDRVATYAQVSPHRTRSGLELMLDRLFFVESAHDGGVNVAIGEGPSAACSELGGHRDFARVAAPSLSYPR